MAIRHPTLLAILISALLISLSPQATSIPTKELDELLTFLRSKGNSRFADAISSTDLLSDFMSLGSLTLLVPTDHSLSALSLTQTPSFYLSTLQLHVVPQLYSWSRILQLPNGSSLPTLNSGRHLHLITRSHHAGDILLVADDRGSAAVPFTKPGFYYSSHVAVHGLAAALKALAAHANHTVFFTPISRAFSTPLSAPTNPENLPHVQKNHTNRTVIGFSSPPFNCPVVGSPSVNHTVFSPPPNVSPFNFTVAVSGGCPAG